MKILQKKNGKNKVLVCRPPPLLTTRAVQCEQKNNYKNAKVIINRNIAKKKNDKNKVFVCRPPPLLTTRAVQCEPLCFQELAPSVPIFYHHHHPYLIFVTGATGGGRVNFFWPV